MYTAKDVKELREKTGAGMMDCKNALEATSGNMDEAVNWLREKGISKASKKESRIAAEGTTKIVENDKEAVILEINSETDFVAKNDEFKNFADKLSNIILNSSANTMEEVLELEEDGIKVSDMIINITAKVGEKISFRRFERVEKTSGQHFGSYSHMNGRIGVLVLLDGANEDVAKDVSMHVAAMNPLYLTRTEVPSEVVEKEREILREQLKNEGKDESKIDGILEGKINKYYQDICLEEQLFIKAEKKENVLKFVTSNNGKILKMIRYEVGEGIEKKQEDFASEVMSQING